MSASHTSAPARWEEVPPGGQEGFSAALEREPPRLGAGVLLICNHLLDLAGRTWSKPLFDDPFRAPPAMRTVALAALRESLDVLGESLHWRRLDEAVRRQMLATELAVLTLSTPDAPRSTRQVVLAWQAAWRCRGALPEALASIRDWEVDNGTPAFPRRDDGSYPSDAQVLTLGNRYPTFLRGGKQPT